MPTIQISGPPEDAESCPISELQMGDRIEVGVYLGPFITTERLRVKSIVQGEGGKYGVTFFGVGTVFIHGSLPVVVVDE
jgi:hypothetical protein